MSAISDERSASATRSMVAKFAALQIGCHRSGVQDNCVAALTDGRSKVVCASRTAGTEGCPQVKRKALYTCTEILIIIDPLTA
jgi:hypothetical protein